MPTVDFSALTFRPLEVADLARLHGWFNAPHAQRWFGARDLDDVRAEYTRYVEGLEPVHAYIVSLEERPIALMNWERLGDFPDLMRSYEVDDPDASNIDVIIGEADFAYRGLGAPLILRFLRELVFSDARITRCIIDPHLENTIAIRAYAKAGFRHVRDVHDDEDGRTLHLMELTRADLFSARSP
jgi:aminoglycoside 6'-N-acetyltransferase